VKTIIASGIIMICCVMIHACATSVERGDSKKNGDEPRKLLPGTWKITSVHCNSKGSNCENYNGTKIFRFDKGGELFVNNVNRGSYRLSGSSCILDAGSTQYNVTIIHIDTARLITGENGRTTTEIFTRIQ
jgi:hypothetical protein